MSRKKTFKAAKNRVLGKKSLEKKAKYFYGKKFGENIFFLVFPEGGIRDITISTPPSPIFFQKGREGVVITNVFTKDFLSKKFFRRFAPEL